MRILYVVFMCVVPLIGQEPIKQRLQKLLPTLTRSMPATTAWKINPAVGTVNTLAGSVDLQLTIRDIPAWGALYGLERLSTRDSDAWIMAWRPRLSGGATALWRIHDQRISQTVKTATPWGWWWNEWPIYRAKLNKADWRPSEYGPRIYLRIPRGVFHGGAWAYQVLVTYNKTAVLGIPQVVDVK